MTNAKESSYSLRPWLSREDLDVVLADEDNLLSQRILPRRDSDFISIVTVIGQVDPTYTADLRPVSTSE
jgi:hypothetical protein